MRHMRHTITLDADVEALLHELMRERGLSFDAAVNHAVRAGLAPGPSPTSRRFQQKTFRMGSPETPLHGALSLALEDEEITRKLDLGETNPPS